MQKKRLKESLEENLLDYELGLEYNDELVNLFYPCHTEHIPNGVWEFWDIVETNIMLVSTGMGGVTFRDSKESTLKLVERYGYDPIIVAPFIDEYESRLLQEHHQAKEEE